MQQQVLLRKPRNRERPARLALSQNTGVYSMKKNGMPCKKPGMRLPERLRYCACFIALACAGGSALAQAAKATECAARSPAAAEAVKRRANVALYYELKLALVEGRVYEWLANGPARLVMPAAEHVAVSARSGYAIDADNRAWSWAAGAEKMQSVFDDAAYLAAGASGLLAIRCDGSLWQRKAAARDWTRVADAAIHAWVGDGADYYIDAGGRLFVSGLAHRGQYGDGRLEAAKGWVAVAAEAIAVHAHTGHAVYLRRDGAVLGSGGNRYGPLGTHGYGDKATTWGIIFSGASGLGTGSSHSLAIRADGSLWSWGAADGLQPRRVLADVLAATGGDNETLAITRDRTIWNWRVGRPPEKVAMPK